MTNYPRFRSCNTNCRHREPYALQGVGRGDLVILGSGLLHPALAGFAMTLLFFLLIFAQGSLAREIDTAALLRTAEAAFARGEYGEVVAAYESVLAGDGPVSAQVYANLGFAYHELGKVGAAIWAYTMAARYAPRDTAIQADLHFLRSQHVSQEPFAPWQRFKKEGAPWTAFFSSAELLVVSVGVYSGFWCMGIVWLFFRGRRLGRWWLLGGCLALFWLVGSFPALHRDWFQDRAILLAETPLYHGLASDEELFVLREGEEVTVLKEEFFSNEQWDYVEASDGRRAWLRNGKFRRLRPFQIQNH